MNLPDSFKAYLEAQKKPASKITIKNYTADLNQFIRWYASNYNNQFHPSLMTPEVLEAFKKAHSENSAASSIERKLSTLRKFSQHLIDEGLITASPFASLAVPKPSDPWKLQEFKNQLINTKASDLTVKNYINDIKQFSEWSAKNTLSSDDISSSINTAALSEYREAMIKTSGLSDASINRKLSSLRRYVSFAEKNNIAKSSALVSNVSPINTKQSGETIAKPASDNLEQATTLPITQTAKHSESPTEHHKQKTYSKFPPLRLAQKIGLLITLGFDATVVAIAAVAVEKFHYISWLASGKQIFVSGAKSGLGLGVKLRELTSDLTQATTQSANGELPPLFNAAKATKELSRFHPTHPGFKFLPKHIQLWGHARHTRPNWYKKYHSYPVVHYFHFAALIIIMSAIGFGLYQSVVQNAQKNQTLAATPPNAPPRILSFQGRLTDSSDNPITSAKDLRFGIYSDPTSSGSALLWQETQRVTADQDGIFSVLLGSSTAIPASVFTNQTGLYLGITVQSDSELAPRQQIATVAFAANSETLQGLYPITAAGAGTSNVVLALDSSGNLTIGGSANPSFSATGGSFSLSGTTLNLNTTAGSNGNVSVTPDGRGLILLNKPVSNSSNNNNITTARGAVEIDDMLAVLATSSGQSAFTLEQDGAGPLFSASVSGAAKFSIANSGVITANNYSTGVAQFDVNGVLSSSALSLSGTNITGQLPTSKGGTGSDLSAATQGSVPYFSATGVMSALAPSTSGYVLTTQGAGANPTWTAASGLGTNYFQLNAGAISPANLSNDFLLGGSSTTSAKFAFINNASGTPTASIAGNLTLAAAGVIQTTLNQTLTIGGASTGNIIIQPTGANFIGIGTTTPTKLLDVQGGAGIVANFSGRVVGGNAVSSNEFVTLSQITGGTGQYWQRALGTLSPTNITDDVLIGGTSTASAKIKFGALANSDSFFNTGGNVGIGSTTPGKQLDVTGDIRASGGLFSSTAAGNPGGNGLFLNYSASTPNTGPAIRWSDGTLPNTIGLYVNAGLNFQGNSSNPDFRIRIPTGTGSLGTEIIHLGAASAASSSWFNGGNVGIGTTNPLGLLNATGSTTTTQGQALVNINQTGTASIFTASNSGVTRFDLAANGSIDQTSTTTTDYGYNLIANSLTSGTALNVNSTSTALTTGGLGVFDWSPASSTTSTGDLLSLNVGANGVLGNIFNVKNNGSSVFAVSQSQITANLPTSFTAPGDTSFAYDINLTNPTASYIKSAAPLYLQSGEIFNSSDLTLSTYNAGNVIIDSQALVANQSASISSQLVVGTNVAPANIGNFYLTNDTTYGKALAILNQTESSDILTGSVSGTTKFVFNSNGNLGIGTALPSQLLDVQGGSGIVANFSGRVAGGNAVSSNEFVTLSQITGGTGQYWQRALGALSPSNITDDVLIGGISTASAKIKFGALANSDSFFNTGGNLGIGTSNPNKQLEISAIKDATLRLSSTLNSSGWTPNTDTAGGVEFYTNDASGGGPNVVGFMKSVTTATAGNLWDLAFGTSSNNAVASEVLRITGGGNVGIGSTAPAFALDVNGNINTSSTYKIGGTDVLSATTLGSGVINSSLTSVGTLTTGTWNASIIGALYGGTGANLSAATQGSVPYFGSTGVMAALAPGTAGFVLSTNGVGANPTWVAASGLGTNYWQRNLGVLSPLNITDDLAIGGTATASSTFQVFGKAYTNNFQTVPSGTASLSGNLVFDSASAQNIDILKGSALNFRTSAGGDAGLATRLTLTSNGNLGIGTTAPRARLENSSQSILGFVSGSTNGIQSGQSILFYNSSAVNWAGLQVDTGGSLLVNTGTSNRFMPLYMTVAGNIGVGTNSASQRLDIFAGNERFSQLPVPAAPLVALAGLGAGNLSNGNYLYRVTFVTAAGETSLSAASATVTVVDNSTDGQVSITGIPTGLPGLVTSRKIYRTTVGGATYRLLTTLANNTTTTFTDNVPDTDLGLQATNLNTTAGDFFVGANRAFHLDTSGNIGIGGGAQAQLPTQKLYLTTGNNIAAEMATIATAINAAPYNDPNGTLTAGTYYFKVAPLDGSGGVGLISTTEASCTVDGVTTNACAVNWSAVQGAVQYRLYKGTTTQAEDRFVPTLGNSTTVNYTSDAVATLGLPPVTVGAYAFKFSSAGASYFNGGNLGIGTGAPTALLQINAPKVASTAAATGTVGTTTLNVTGTAGGDTFISTTGTGGAGSALTLVGGVGGTASAALTSSIGGAGGAVNFTGGVGGLANIFGTGNNTGGAGGAFTWAGGAGGAATGSTSGNNLSGAGAAISLIAGTSGVANSLNDTAGNITTGNGGALTINSGTAGLSSYTGTGTVGNIIGGNGGTYTQTAGTGGAASITNIGAGAAVTGGNGAAYNITSGTGGAASLTGGGSATTVTGGTAGTLSISGGTGGAASLTNGTATGNVAGGNGGAVTISGGTGGAGITTGGTGGTLTLNGGLSSTSQNASGGAVAISGRSSSATGTGGAGGAVTIAAGSAAGDNTVARPGGLISLAAGASKGPGQAGGAITFASGAGGSNINTGTATGPNSGGISLTIATAGSATLADVLSTGGNGGTYTISGGAGGAASVAGTGANTGGSGSTFTWQAGSGGAANGVTSATNTGGAGGAVSLISGTGGAATAGSGSLVGGTGGVLTLRAGTGGAGTTGGNGGATTIQGGTAATTGPGVGGALTLVGGIGGSTGSGGSIIFNTSAVNSSATRMTITNAGNVGIGSTLPGGLFAIRSSVAATPIATFSAGISPTVDMVSITNGSFPITTAGVNALSINYTGGNAAVESGAVRLDLKPGGLTGGTWDGYRIVANATGPVTGVTENLVKIEAPVTGGAGTLNGILFNNITTPGAGTETALNVGTGYDSILSYNGTTIINGTGITQSVGGGTGADLSAAVQGSIPYFSSTGVMSALVPGTAGYVLTTNGVGANPTWTAAAGLGTNYWQLNNNVLSPSISNYDLAIGGTATSSATFQVFALANGSIRAGTASMSGDLVLNSAASIQTTKNQTLTIGGNTTGNVIINPASANMVGIGTTTPKNDLDVNGQVAIGTYAGTNVAPTGGLIVSGNVGIGTSLPAQALGVNGKATIGGTGFVTNPGSELLLYKSGNVDTDGPMIRFAEGNQLSGTSDGQGYAFIQSYRENNAANRLSGLVLGTQGLDRLHIDSSGNIGIGSTTPTAKLDVVGTASVSSNLTFRGASTAHVLGIDDNGSLNIATAGTGQGDAGLTSRLFIQNNGNIGIGSSAPTQAVDINQNDPILRVFATTNSRGINIYPSNGTIESSNVGLYLNRNNSNSVLLGVGGGNVGIGSGTPVAKLDVAGNANIQGYATVSASLAVGYSSVKAGTGNGVFSGFIGVGTTNPTKNIDVLTTTTDAWLRLQSTNNGSGALVQLTGKTVGGSAINWTYGFNRNLTGGQFEIYDEQASADRIVIDSTGNVGIGSTAPIAKLDVAGNANIQGYATASASLAVGYSSVLAGTGNGVFSGNVGIGSTLPAQRLDVAGSGAFSTNVLAGGVLQAGGTTAVAYNRFGTSATTHSLSANNDLLVNGKLEIDGASFFDTAPTFSTLTSCTAIQTDGSGNTSCNNTLGANYWQRLAGNLSPVNANDTLSATSSASTVATFTTNNGAGTLTNNTLINHSGAGTVTNLLNLTQSAGTVTNAISTTGTFGNVLTVSGTPILNSTGVLLSAGLSGTYSSALTLSNASNAITAGTLTATGGSINGTTIGASTPSTGAFTTLTSSGATTLGTGSSLTNTFGSGASSVNTIGSTSTPGALTLHGATTLDNTFTVSGSNLTSLGGNLAVTGTVSTGGSVRLDASGNLSNIGTIASTYLTTTTNNVNFNGASTVLQLNGTTILDASRNLTNIGTTQFNTQTYTWPGSQLSNGILQTNGSGTLSWADPASLGTNYWQLNNKVLSPNNSTYDLTIGGTATTSAKFQVLALANGTISAGTASTSGDLTFNGTGGSQNINILKGGSLNFRTATTGKGDAGLTTKMTLDSMGNLGIGNTAPTYPVHVSTTPTDTGDSAAIYVDSTITGTVNSLYGITAKPYFAPTSASTSIHGGLSFVPVSDSNNLTNGSLAGLYGGPYYYGTGTVGALYGGYFQNQLDAAGTITNAYGVYIDNPYKSAGTITNNIGLYVEAQTNGTNNIGLTIGEATGTKNTNLLIGTTTQPTGSYSIYNSSTDQNYFAGNLGIGSTAPTQKLDVTGNVNVSGSYKVAGNDVLTSNTLGTGVLTSSLTTVGILNAGSINTGFGNINNGTSGITTNVFTSTQATGTAPFTVASTTKVTNLNADLLDGIDSTGFCQTGGTGCPAASSYWQLNSNVLAPGNTSFDLAIGGTATSSATFQVFALANGTTPAGTASMSGNLTLNSAASIQTTKNQTLTLGGNTTGNIIINPTGTNNVGIGTSSPLAKIDIATSGTGRILGDNFAGGNYAGFSFNGGTTINDYNILSSPTDKNLYLNRPSGSQIQLIEANGSAQLAIASGGNVGIGTSNPTSFKLQVVGNVGPDATNTYDLGSSSKQWNNIYGNNYYQNGTLVNLTNYWQRNAGAVSPANITDDLLLGATATASAKIRLGGTTNADSFFNTGGNVGIGTTAPLLKLDVRGGMNLMRGITGTGLLTGYYGNINNTTSVFQVDANTYYGNAYVAAGNNQYSMWQEFLKTRSTDGSTNAIVSNNDELGRFNFAGDDGTNFRAAANILISVDGTPGASDMPGRIAISTTPDGSATPVERLRINNQGNVGIGSTLPETLLNVGSTGTIRVGKQASTENETSITTSSIINTYNITDSRFGLFSNGTAQLSLPSGHDGGALRLGTGGNYSAISGGGSSNSQLSFYTGGDFTNTRLFIDAVGNVGIGTTNPTSFILQAAGNVGPNATNTYDLGSASLQWNNIYANNFYQNGTLVNLTNYWQLNNKVVSPSNSTYDLAVGGSATSSAVFQVFALANGTTPAGTASMSGNLTLNSASSIQTTNNRTLTIGGNTTGNIIINPTGTNLLGVGTTNPTQKLDVAGNIALAAGGLIDTNAAGSLLIGTGTNTSALTLGKSGGTTTLNGNSSSTIAYTNFTVAAGGNIGVTSGQGLDTIAGSGTLLIGNVNATTLTLGAVASTLNIGPSGATASTIAIAGGSGATGCTVDGATGNLTCSGNITSTGGAVGAWQRNLGALSPTNITDDVLVGATATASARIKLSANGTSPSFFNGGNVGIGSTAPLALLDVKGASTGHTLVGVMSDATTYGAVGFSSTLTSANYVVAASSAETLINAPSGQGLKFRIANADKMILDSTGNVGIGTTSPGARLDVAGGILALDNGDFAGTRGLRFRNTTDTTTPNGGGLYEANNNVAYLQAGSAEFIRLRSSGSSDKFTFNTSTGNLGINTTGPTAQLQIVGGTAGTPLVQLSAGVVPTVDMIQITNSGQAITATGTNALSINYTVGATNAVGWESAAQRIDFTTGTVSGNTQTVSGLRLVGSTTGSSSINENGIKIDNITGGAGNEYGVNIGTGWDRGISSASDAYLTKFVDFDGTNYFVDPAATLYSAILNSTVGIGTTTPIGLLNVEGKVNGKALAIFNQTGNQDIFTASQSGTTKFVINNAGNVGIGTASPNYSLQIGGAGIATFGASGTYNPNVAQLISSTTNNDMVGLVLSVNEGVNNRRAMFYLDDNLGEYGFQSKATTGVPDFVIKAGSTEAFRVTNNGNIGLGTSSPQALLSLWDSTNFASTGAKLAVWEDGVGSSGQMGLGVASSEFRIMYPHVGTNHLSFGTTRFGGNQWTENMRLDQNGNLGLGTSAPGMSLDIVSPNTTAGVGITNTGTGGGTGYNISATNNSNALSGDNFVISSGGSGTTARFFAYQASSKNVEIARSGGNVGIGGISIGGVVNALQVNGGITGASVTDSQTTCNTTATVAGNGLTYYLNKNTGTTNSSSTCTWDITGLPDTDGTVAFFVTKVQKGATAGSVRAAANVKIQGHQIISAVDFGTATQTGADSSSYNFTVARINGSWTFIINDDPTAALHRYDIGEYIQGDSSLQSGMLVANSPTQKEYAVATSQEYQPEILGIISTAGQIIGKKQEGDLPLTLAGRIPTFISTINGPISMNDPITTSTIPGFGMKATKSGMIVGRAMATSSSLSESELNNANCPVDFQGQTDPNGNPVKCGKIIVNQNRTWFEPAMEIAQSGNLSVSGVDEGSFTAWANSYKIEDKGGFADAVIARLTAGIIKTQQLVVNGTSTFLGDIQAQTINASALTVNSLTFAGQSLHDYIISVVQQAGFNNNTSLTSPVANIDQINTNIISPLGSDKVQVNGNVAIKKTNGVGGNLSVEGDASVSGQLTASDASISGTLRAGHIIADEIDGLNARIASIAANSITATSSSVTNIYNTYNTASNSGTLAASESGSMTAQSLISDNLYTGFADIASLSAHLATVPNLTADTATINQGLMVFGTTSLSDTSVVGQLSVNGSLILSDNSINVLGATFEIQPLKQGNVSFEGGLVAIDTDGNLTVNGNANFAHDVTVGGKLTASIVSPIPDSDLIFQLPGSGADSSTLAIDRPGIVVKNGSGSAVLKITDVGDVIASGAASASQFQVIRTVAADTSSTQTIATASAGTATIKLGQYERTIVSPFVTSKSLVYITAATDTNGVTPFIARQTAEDKIAHTTGSFTIRIPVLQNKDVKVNWWIIN